MVRLVPSGRYTRVTVTMARPATAAVGYQDRVTCEHCVETIGYGYPAPAWTFYDYELLRVYGPCCTTCMISMDVLRAEIE